MAFYLLFPVVSTIQAALLSSSFNYFSPHLPQWPRLQRDLYSHFKSRCIRLKEAAKILLRSQQGAYTPGLYMCFKFSISTSSSFCAGFTLCVLRCPARFSFAADLTLVAFFFSFSFVLWSVMRFFVIDLGGSIVRIPCTAVYGNVWFTAQVGDFVMSYVLWDSIVRSDRL